MTREAWFFQRALLASLLFHVLLLTLFMTLPGGGPAQPVQIYTVRILEAPVRPEARELTLSTEALSALKLESPSLNVDRPPPPEPDQADVPSVETFPRAMPVPPTSAPSLAPPQREAPSLPGPRPPAPRAAPPALPSLPAPAPPASAPGPARRASRPAAGAPPPLPEDEPARPSAMEQLRSRVQALNLQVEAAPPRTAAPEPQPGAERNVLSLRLYSNRVREAVKEQYTFPGGFEPGLRTRVRVVLNRDGTVRSTELLESSGNERFDRLVCLGAFNKAKIPPIPQGIEGDGDTLTLNFTCSP